MRLPFFLLFLLFPLSLNAQNRSAEKTDTYQVSINLNEVQNDQLKVDILVPSMEGDTSEFIFPKIVPGTYSISDYGRFISEFKAFDSLDNSLPVQPISVNQFQIKNSSRLKKISYWVHDTFDSPLENPIFEPAGTNIEANKNYLINTFGFIGFFKGYENNPFKIIIKHSSDLYGATSLKRIYNDAETDIFHSKNYVNLADSPIMYCKPDTSHLIINGTHILVSVYSPNGLLSSDFVLKKVKETLAAQKAYLGGSLPVDRYTFIIYLSPLKGISGSWGALEHSYSSVFFLPEVNPEALARTIRNVSAHEFFHIVTPLNLHSEEIQYFDFLQPKMSEHLWLYEGVTEYSAMNMQVKYKLMNLQDYLAVIQRKINAADRFNDNLPFTVMSKGCLDKYADQYENVYQKGALIAMCLDIKLIELSNGKYNLQALIRDLSKLYGPNKPFKDHELFDKIEELTYPEIGIFLKNYVAGTKKLPYRDILALVGVNFIAHEKIEEITLGNITLDFNPETQRVYIKSLKGSNEFAKEIKYKVGDEIIKLNGMELNSTNFQYAFNAFKNNTNEGDKVIIQVARRRKTGNFNYKRLKAKAMKITLEKRNSVEIMNQPSLRQLDFRKIWTNP
ncbi:peptidase M61 [Xanthovirga aplysinae]|uniref:M61 family metallopeptidase n=1 Tax=Xanthovirga aplysinae TaxID=2529853 RepID=UPI0012BD0A03|nr:peptidase M61 [Xanthovirga aplysinae]MTI30491.1 peptidase M61 [Xanthovirga aplysinae]